jgi:hypothetical protein
MPQVVAKVVTHPNQTHFLKAPPHAYPSPYISNFSSRKASSGFGFGGLDAVATSQVACENLSTPEEKAPSSKQEQKRRTTSFTFAPYIPPFITPLGNKSIIASPSGEEPQGPSPVDNDLELEAEFPLDMVVEMQEGAAKNTQRMVIGQTIESRLTIKVLNDCLKLHLPTSYISTTLLTRGFFEALLSDEEGTKMTRKITTVEWSDMSFFFSKNVSNFDASIQGAEALLTHTIKIQFPDLHE